MFLVYFCLPFPTAIILSLSPSVSLMALSHFSPELPNAPVSIWNSHASAAPSISAQPEGCTHVSPALLVCCALHLFHSTLLNTNLWTSHSPTHKARRCFHACAHTASTFSWNVSHHFSYSLQSLRCSSSPAFSTRPMRLGHFRLTSASLQLQKQ